MRIADEPSNTVVKQIERMEVRSLLQSPIINLSRVCLELTQFVLLIQRFQLHVGFHFICFLNTMVYALYFNLYFIYFFFCSHLYLQDFCFVRRFYFLKLI